MTAPRNPITEGLQQVLATHHACVFGYPALGTHLSDDGQVGQARTDEAAHRLTRDSLAAQLVALGQTPVPAEVGYAPPKPVTSAASAQQWAVALEERAAVAYRYLLVCCIQAAAGGSATAVSAAAVRKQALTGLTTGAQAATYWRRLTTPDQPTIAFPGVE